MLVSVNGPVIINVMPKTVKQFDPVAHGLKTMKVYADIYKKLKTTTFAKHEYDKKIKFILNISNYDM